MVLLKKISVQLALPVRRKSFRVKQKWVSTAKPKGAAELALEHFDFFYKPIYRRWWPSIRLGLLSDPKYSALINNYGDSEKSVQYFEERGAMDMLAHIRNQKSIYQQKMGLRPNVYKEPSSLELDTEGESEQFSEIVERETEVSNVDMLSRTEDGLFQFVPTDTLSAVAKDRVGIWDNDETRQILTESQPGSNVQVEIVPDEIIYPEHLKLMTYPRGDITLFPQAKPGSNGVIRGLVCNDVKVARVSRLRRMLTSYIPEDNDIRDRIILKRKDAASLSWDETDKYDKVLVDAPCTTDRHCLQEMEDSLFRRSRSQERLTLPNTQANILLNGIRATRPGGVTVYSTCTLSPLQNQAVVESAVAIAVNKYNMKLVVKDLSSLKNDCKRAQLFRFYSNEKYGALIVPFLPNNFGPTYVCKLQRIL